jgi:hypothetical protein
LFFSREGVDDAECCMAAFAHQRSTGVFPEMNGKFTYQPTLRLAAPVSRCIRGTGWLVGMDRPLSGRTTG